MLKKLWMLLLAVALVFGLTVGCKGSGAGDGDESGGVAFSFEGPFKYYLWGSTGSAPTLTAAEDAVIIEANSSTGFGLRFDDMGYTFNRTDYLVITYHIEIEEPTACLNFKQMTKADSSGVDFKDVSQTLTDYGVGKGREAFLGHDTASVYEAPPVAAGKTATEGTWDPATKTGTFEIKLSTFDPSGVVGIGFQHNFWAEYPQGTKVGEDSKYTVKFLKVENKVTEDLLAPVITTQPASARIAIGSAAPTLTVAADDPPSGADRAIQWQKQDGDDWTDISGATGTSLATGVDTSAEGTFRFRAVVSNVRGTEVASTNSSVAMVTVYDDAVPTADIDLGAFTWINNDNQKGWKSGHCDDEDFALDVADVVSASHLVLEVTSLPDGGMCMIWQGDGNSWDWAQGDNILEDDGTPKAGVEIEGNTIKIDLSVAIKDYSDFLASTTGVKFLIQYYGGAVADVDALGIVRAYLTGVSVAPRTTDLDAFTWINNDNQKGWKSGHCDDEDFALDVADVVSAVYLVLDVTSLPDGGMCMIWQGDGNSWDWAQGDNILEDDGTPKAGVTIQGNTIKIDLSVAIKDYSDFLASATGVKFLIQYYGGAVADVDALGIVRAYLTY